MSGRPLLIAAFSGRALAQSARRAGYVPLVVDCFGDDDMREAAADSICLPARVQVGFKRKPLLEALDQLTARSSSPPLGLVLGAGFECNPRLVAALGERFRLIGNTADTIRNVKNPETFFGSLKDLGIRHPDTQLTPPSGPDGWLMKRIGGSGGLHIHACPAHPRPDKRRYFQRRIGGTPVSAMLIRSPSAQVFCFTSQWVSPRPRRPYRYGGASGWIDLDGDTEARIVDICLQLGKAFDLIGMVSFDFLVDEGEPVLLEINPRPGAALDVLDDESGTLLRAHVEACLIGEDPAAIIADHLTCPPPTSAAYFYSDRGPLTIPETAWPDWVLDRPRCGTAIPAHQPVATVLARAPTQAGAEQLCQDRLRLLEQMLYESPERQGAMT